MASSLSRMLSILELFDEEHPTRSAEEVCALLQLSTSTGYRYIRELCAAGLLGRMTGGNYLLGVRIVELEYVMRMSDPSVKLGSPILAQLVAATGCDALLSNFHGTHVINVLRERGTENLAPTYLRGRQHPLFRGAVAKAILPFLPRSQLVRIYAANAARVRESGMGATWLEFWRALQAIKRRGYSESHGELDPSLYGLGVPVFAGTDVVGSISLVFSRKRSGSLNQEGLVKQMQAASKRLSLALERFKPAPRRGKER
jgi:DNA-binding IclR family transcriptional regulator